VTLNGQGVDNEGALLNVQGLNEILGVLTSNFGWIGCDGDTLLYVLNLAGMGLVEISNGPVDGLDGDLILSNNNMNYQGQTVVLSGLLSVLTPNSLGQTGDDDTTIGSGATLYVAAPITVGNTANEDGDLTLENGSTLILHNGSNWAGSIALDGGATVSIGELHDAQDGDSARISGDIAGIGNASLAVTGSLTLSGYDSYGGDTTVSSGTLKVESYLAGSVVLQNGAKLNGTPSAQIGELTALSGSTVIDGGETVMGSVSLEAGSIFYVTLTASTSADALVATHETDNMVTLGATLQVNLAAGFMPSVGESFLLISNQTDSPINGTFSDQAEKSTFKVNGLSFQITYEWGADDDDIVITRIA
jgi:autotransporter-associated beta strand protein